MVTIFKTSRIKKSTLVFLVAQIMDFITSALGLYMFPMSISEYNPIMGSNLVFNSFLKFIIVIGVAVIIEKKDYGKMVWLIPFYSSIAPVINMLTIVLEVIG